MPLHHEKAGGPGVAPWALRPEQATQHGHEHIQLHAGKEFPEMDLDYITLPLLEKRQSRRVSEKIPIMLPSTLFRKFVEHAGVLSKDAGNFRKMVEDLPCYDNHPVVQRARATCMAACSLLVYLKARSSGLPPQTRTRKTGRPFISGPFSNMNQLRKLCRPWNEVMPHALAAQAQT